MKILQVTPRYPPHTGGVETHVKEISERLVQRGHEVVVHTADAGGDVEKREIRKGVKIHRHQGFAPGGAFHIAPGITTVGKCAEADIVHAHNYHSFPALFATFGLTKDRFFVTPHYHGSSNSDFRSALLSLYRPLGRNMLHRADEVVAVSNWERRQIKHDFGLKARVIPNGIDVERFRNPTSLRPPEYDDYILTVGRLEEYKGIQYLVEAITQLDGKNLVVAGSGPYLEDLKQLVSKRGLSNSVYLEGYVSDERLVNLYRHATVYATLSRFEAYGMTVGEALAANTPCVVLKHAALQDWVDKPGVIGVESTDSEVISKAIRDARSLDPSKGSLPTWSDVVDDLEELYAYNYDEKS